MGGFQAADQTPSKPMSALPRGSEAHLLNTDLMVSQPTHSAPMHPLPFRPKSRLAPFGIGTFRDSTRFDSFGALGSSEDWVGGNMDYALRYLGPRYTQLRSLKDGSWGMLREAAASVLAYELYPLGIATASVPVLPPLWKKDPGTRVPVLFIHGLLHNTSTFAWIKQKMALDGWRDFQAVNLSTVQHTIPQMAEQTLLAVEKMRQRYGVEQVDVIAHSLGGVLARYILQVQEQDGLFRRLITLGTPHTGTEISRYAFLSHLRELAPGSETMEKLRLAPVLQKTQAVSVSGSLDVMLWPREAGHWHGVRNIHLKHVGHAGLLFSKRVIQIISAHLKP